MEVKELIQKLLDQPLESEIMFLAKETNVGYPLMKVETSDITNRTWISDK